MSATKPYQTHLTLHAALPEDQSVLAHFDTIVVGEAAYATLKEEHKPKAILYIDVWAHSSYNNGPAWAWQKRPGDIGMPDYVMYFAPGRPTHCYNWKDYGDHAGRMKLWMQAAVGMGVKGLFLDDWNPHRSRWTGDEAIKKIIWPGYPSWAYFPPKFDAIYASARSIAKTVIVNGDYRKAGQPRMAENVGGGGEPWVMLEEETENPKYVQAGDLLQLNIVKADGTVSPANLAKFARAMKLAKERKASLGVAYETSPGGSIYQLIPGMWGDPNQWPK